MRTIFDKKLEEIHRDLLQLGILVNNNIYNAVESFIENNLQQSQKVIDDDKIINAKKLEIDLKAIEIIALQHPNATDLRKVLSVMGASSSLERMGDHAKEISESTISIEGSKRKIELEKLIQQIGFQVMDMSKDIIDAFVDFNVETAKEIAARDREVDIKHQKLRFIGIELMKNDSDSVIATADYLFIGMHLERIGDYVTNVAEDIVYLDTGNVVDLNRKKKISADHLR